MRSLLLLLLALLLAAVASGTCMHTCIHTPPQMYPVKGPSDCSDAQWVECSLTRRSIDPLDPNTHTGYKPSATPTKPAAAKAAASKAANKPPAAASSNKPGPLATLFEVYTRGAGDKAALSPEEAALQRDRQYTLITGLPLKPYFERKTVRRQVAPDIWTLEQVGGD